MSMENAILAHAAALNNLAQALRLAFAGGTHIPVELALTTTIDGKPADPLDAKAADLAGATKERAAKARDAAAKDAQQNAAGVKPDADLEQAVAKVEDDAKIEKARIDADTKKAEADKTEVHLDTLLDYAKDVRPVLLAAIKKAGKDKVQALINTFGVDKADKVDAGKFGELLAGAQKLAA